MAETNLYKILDKIIDRLKLVGEKDTTGFVKNGSEVVSSSGLTPTPIIEGVPYYREVEMPEVLPLSKGLYFDFLTSAIDLISYEPIELQNVSISSSGLVFNSSSCYAILPGEFLRKNNSYEIEITSMNMSDTTRHNDLFRFKDLDGTSNAGLIYRYQTGTWSVWDSTTGWQDSTITSKDYFNNSTLKVKILSDGKWEIYKDNSLVFAPPTALTFEGTTDFGIGSPNASIVNMTVKSFRLYVNGYEHEDGILGNTNNQKEVFYGVCETAASTTAKTVTLSDVFTLTSGQIFIIKFLYDVPVNATLNINNTGALSLKYRSHNIRTNDICAQDKVTLVYDGASYNILAVDSINYSTDIDMRVTPSYLGQVAPGTGRMCQGMTSDGTYLYMASISTSDLMSSPQIHRITPSTLAVSTKSPSKKGHYNNLNYYNGYIYATGFNTSDVNDDYSQVYKYRFSDNTGSVITTNEWYWNFAIGNGPYNSKFYVGYLASRPAFSIYTTPSASTSNTPSFVPWTQCPIEYYNGIEQGCAIYDSVSNGSHYNYICTVLTDYRTVYPNSTHSSHMLIVTNLTGQTVKRIRLMLPDGFNEELEDICFIGNKAYINSSTGRIFVIDDVTKLFRGFYENVIPVVWQKPCWMYIYTNQSSYSEQWYTGTYGSTSGRLLKSFRISPLAYDPYSFSSATGIFVFRGKYFPFKINPNSKNITIQISAVTTDNYEFDITLTYNRTSDSSNYIYQLASITGGYRNTSGAFTAKNSADSSIQDCCNAMFYSGDSYINNIIVDYTVPYAPSQTSF